MPRLTLARVALGLAATGAAATGVYFLALRPTVVNWGATAEEARRSLPGDEVVPSPKVQVTHAITIDAPPDAVWPWLAQIGCGRAGWYSYDLLDNAGIPSARQILPEFQSIKVGDMIPMVPDGRLAIPVVAVEAGRSLVLGGAMDLATGQSADLRDAPVRQYFAGAWSFNLLPAGERSTRLLARGRMDWSPGPQTLPYYALEPITFIMQRKMLLGIKERAEAGAR